MLQREKKKNKGEKRLTCAPFFFRARIHSGRTTHVFEHVFLLTRPRALAQPELYLLQPYPRYPPRRAL